MKEQEIRMKKRIKTIYLDVCALSRPFDEQDYLRIRLETEAVNLILSKVRESYYRLLVSSAHVKEIEAIPDVFERIELQTLLDKLGEPAKVDLIKTRIRAEELVDLGFGVADAAHVTFAEQAGYSFIMSCDDKLVKKCLNHKINVWCGNPVTFCEMEDLR
jgi:predicted nucleic acid-binding protein